MKLDPLKVPVGLAALLPLAERWGIEGSFERSRAVNNAGPNELEELLHCLDRVDAKVLEEWLTGSESLSDYPSNEYVAITCLTMTVDQVRMRSDKTKK